MDNLYSSRKFILASVILLAAIGMLWTQHIDATVYSDITKWTLGLYFTGNVVEKIGLVPKA